MRRKIRYLRWRWFGYLRTNERMMFEHYRDNGYWPWERSNHAEQECWMKTGWLTGERYCGLHGRNAGWPCALGGGDHVE